MTWTGKFQRARCTSRKRLRCERLERRSLLAVASFHLDFFEDVEGIPGERIADNTVEVGEAFFVEVRAREHDPGVAGLAGVSLDIAWDAPLLEVVEPFDPQAAVTSNLPVMVRGTLHQDESSVLPFLFNNQVRHDVGHIAGLGGSSFSAYGIGQPIGSDGNDMNVRDSMRGLATTDDHFAWLHFRADQSGEGMFTMRQGGSGIATVPVLSLSSAQLDFEVKTLTIVEPSESSQTQPTSVASSTTDTRGGPNLSGTTSETSTAPLFASPPRIELATGSEQIQFTTGPGAKDAAQPLVRPAVPDGDKFIDVSNTGDTTLIITEIHINVPDVTMAGGGHPIVVQPGQTKRLAIAYAPSTPNPADATAQSFDVTDGIVIFSNAVNAPIVEVGLRGDSTFDADTNYDGRVDLADLISFDRDFGLQSGDDNYSPRIDPNGDGVIDVADLREFAAHFHRSREVPVLGPVQASILAAAESEGQVGSVRFSSACLAAPGLRPNVAVMAREAFRSVLKASTRSTSFSGSWLPPELAKHVVFAEPENRPTSLANPHQLDDDLVDLLASDLNSQDAPLLP